MHKISLIVIFLSVGILPIFAATPFFANDAFTQNGIEWCEENLSLYQILGNGFFEHHNHSIESRVCASLIEDSLWSYSGPDRAEKLIDKSRYYVQLEISESAKEAETGIIDTTPAESHKIFLEEKLEMLSPENSDEPEKIIEISEENTNSGGGCLIATATYGTELAPQVQMLREIRDNSLMQTQSGQKFMNGFNELYYSFSPTIADLERKNSVFKETVRITITPLLISLSLLNYVEMDSESEVLGYGISLILLNIGMYFVAPTILFFKRKHIQKNLKFVH